MDDIDGLDALETEAKALEETLGSVTAMTEAFDGQLRRMQGALGATTRDLGQLERGFSGGVRKAFDGLVFDGKTLSDAFSTLGEAMSRTVYSNATTPASDHFGGILAGGVTALVSGMMPFEKGGALSGGQARAFARSRRVEGATPYAMRAGLGLMGEAGPDAIIPFARGMGGGSGVKAQGASAIQVTMNISTPDVAGFQRSQSQIAAQMGRALSRGQRNR